MWNFEKSMDGGRLISRKCGKNSKKAPLNEGKGCAKGPSIGLLHKKKTRKSAKNTLQSLESEKLMSLVVAPEVRKLF